MEINKSIGNLIVAVTLLIIAFFAPVTNAWKETIFKILIGIGIALVISAIAIVIEKWSFIKLYLQTNWWFKRNKSLRISFAYLFRIEQDGKYLLVQNSRNINGYQPPGGVYKYLRREMQDDFDKWGLVPDTKINRDEMGEDDLRMVFKKRKKLSKFLKWFHMNRNRETSPWREFYEELVFTGVLSRETFPHIQYNLVRSVYEGVKFSAYFDIDEVKYADVFELKIVNDYQKKALRDIMLLKDQKFIWATKEEIEAKKFGDKTILEHTIKII